MRAKFGTWSTLAAVLAAAVLVAGGAPAMAAGTAQSTIPSQLPGKPGTGGYVAPITPQILDGTAADGSGYRVLDMAQVGNRIVVAGVFAQVQNPGSNGTIYPRSNVFAFDPSTGLVDPNFAPVVNGQVNAVAAGANGTVFLGGQFGQVNGAGPPRLALVNLSDGARVTTFTTPVTSSSVQDISVSLATNRAFIAGTFTTVNGLPRGGLASLNATTGALDQYMSLSVAGHHNYGVNPPPVGKTASQAPVGVSAIDVSPDGTRMIAIGNFTSVSSPAGTFSRDQVASIQLTATGAAVDGWATLRYHDPCKVTAFDSYVRDVQWAPDGSYFVIVATGAYYAGTACDAAARFNAADTGTTVQPAWVSYTGGDSLWSVAATGAAVYVGGHQRWGNNPLAGDKAGPGAAPRPGITALDPLSGVPLSWNPGRNPRGVGAEALLATGSGLYVGMDTDWIGNLTYQRKKLAYFPLAGGRTPPSQDTGSLATDNVYLAGTPGGGDNLIERSYDGTTAGPDAPAPSTGGVAWSSARGAFMAGNTLYYGFPDSSGVYEMARQSFDGKSFGSQQILDTPYKDPTWDGVNTGSGTVTYDGMFPNFYGAELKSVTGMFYANGRLYYATPSGLFYRGFSIDSGIVGATSVAVPSTVFDFTQAGGMFLDGSNLYVANRVTGALSRMTFGNGVPSGTATVVSDPASGGRDWRAQGLFLGPTGAPPPNQPPKATFAPPSCTGLTCTFDASASSDPENGPLTYAWDFGDGLGTGVKPSHTYTAGGTYTVKLTVTDNQGATDTATQSVTVVAPPPGIVAKSATGASTPAGASSITVTYPSVSSNDGLVLILSIDAASTSAPPAGFTQVAQQTALVSGSTTPALTTQVFQKVATGSEGGTKLTVQVNPYAKATLQLVDYSGTSTAGPIRVAQGLSDNGGTSHTTPGVTANAGEWVVSVWSDRASAARSWVTPTGTTMRNNLSAGTTQAEVATLVADSGGPITTPGTQSGIAATVTAADGKATMLSLVLAPA